MPREPAGGQGSRGLRRPGGTSRSAAAKEDVKGTRKRDSNRVESKASNAAMESTREETEKVNAQAEEQRLLQEKADEEAIRVENERLAAENEAKLREMEERRAAARREFKKCGVKPENFNVREFNTNMSEFIQSLEQPRFNMVDSDYPVEELTSVVTLVSKSVKDYKSHTTDSQHQLEELTDAMARIRENLHFSLSRQAMDMRTDGEDLSQEELDLQARAAQLTAQLAKVNSDVTEAIRLTTEAETAAVKADIAAERAREETRRVQEEATKKEEAERYNKEQQKKKMEEKNRRKEEEERKEREAIQKKESEWKKREALLSARNANVYDSWPEVEFEQTNENGEVEVTCVIRGDPACFTGQELTCRRAKEKEALLTYLPNEEVISHVVDLEASGEEGELKSPVFVAIPHLMTRHSGQSREPVVKAWLEGQWLDLPTRDITLDSRKDSKFAQAEVRQLTTLVVMSRYKRDYVTLASSRQQRVTSSFDQRITFTTEKGTFPRNEHLLLEVQPIDSSSMADFKSREPVAKALLTSSSILHTTWEAERFNKPVQVNLSCPPNPTKARKMALARKLKEEKMKNPKPVVVIDFEAQEKEKEREKKRLQTFVQEDGGDVLRKPTKWYMGQYANNDDDETDQLHFVYFHGGKWLLDPGMTFKQVKVDVVCFKLKQPLEKFMVLRTRTNIEEDEVLAMVIALNDYLNKKFVEAVVRQRSDDPLEVALHVSPISRVEAVLKSLETGGYESGPAPSHVITLHEGDVIELGFSGNIECKDRLAEQLVFKTNVPTVTYFRVTEENKFRQKDQGYFSGLIVLSRRYLEPSSRAKRGEEEEPCMELRRERMCALQINIPKDHVEANTSPRRAPVTLRTSEEPVDGDLLVMLADSMGEEWRKVAHYLGVRRARVQAIVRNMHVSSKSERDARLDMLLTWLKAAPRALDKVASLTSALRHGDRYDLAETVQEKGREYWSGRRIPVQ